MQKLQKIALRLILAGFAMIVATDLATAQRLRIQSPEARMDTWRSGILNFIEKHPSLANDQVLALQNLADIADTRTFEASLDSGRRDFLAGQLQEIGRVLPYMEYLKLLRSFGDLRLWLVANNLATQFQVALPDCNCTVGSNCQSGTCKDVACEPKGTTHTGVCAAAE